MILLVARLTTVYEVFKPLSQVSLFGHESLSRLVHFVPSLLSVLDPDSLIFLSRKDRNTSFRLTKAPLRNAGFLLNLKTLFT